MRLYSTLDRSEVELPEPPGPVRIYVCGPTVYQRIHVGNARPFVVSMWLRPARLAHRVLGDGREVPRAPLRDPRRRARPRLPAPRERDRAVARRRARVRPRLHAQRDAADDGGEDVQVAWKRRQPARGAGRLGARDAARLLPARALA